MKLEDLINGTSPQMDIVPIMSIESLNDLKDAEMPNSLPILALRNAVLFPATVIPVTVGRDKSIKLIKDADSGNKIIGAVTQLDSKIEDPGKDDLNKIGTMARIIKVIEMPDGTITAILQGVRRFIVDSVAATEPYMIAGVTYLSEIHPLKSDADIEAISSSIKEKAGEIIRLTPNMPDAAAVALNSMEGYEFIINFVASSVELDQPTDKIALLDESSIKERGMKLLELMNKQIEILKLKADINNKVKTEIDQQQREYYLNNQLKTIQEELGMGTSDDMSDFKERAAKKKWSKEVADAFDKELKNLSKINPSSPDYNVQYSYVNFMLDLPWGEMTPDNLDLQNAQKVLDEDHYGLDTVKDRIIEYLAVLKLKGNMKSPIMCLYGPPGVGKTSLGKSVARSLGRKYGRISLGGMSDESEIRGHRKTYIGAMPGRIMQTIKKCGSSNPVIVLDEIDKVSDVKGYNGDPAAALLEVLDPEQNTTFHDNYLDIDYDLSHVLFITTANDISTIQPALRDRMEMIPISGYVDEEKVEIAKRFLIPKEIEASGLKKSQFNLNVEGLNTVIDQYTRESGVRGLDKQIARLTRITAKKIALKEIKKASLGPDEVREALGLPTNNHDLQKGNEGPGVVTGLAWTEMGGEILFVECSLSDGKGMLTTTGNLGDVMKESATIALEYLKAHPELIGVDSKIFKSKDIHIHVPEGAIPKDGPSAGVTMVSSMASALCRKAVRHGIAMTGEITLRGKVLPIGGVKEKILAAKRAGITTVLLPRENERDIKEINEMYLKGLTFVYVDTIPELLDYVFSKPDTERKD
jgi:ATP-dependent Lon protease